MSGRRACPDGHPGCSGSASEPPPRHRSPRRLEQHVGTFGEVTWPSGEDRAPVPGRPAAFDDVVTEATKRIGLLAGQVEVVMDDEDPSHLTPLSDAQRAGRVGRRSANSGPRWLPSAVADVTRWQALRPRRTRVTPPGAAHDRGPSPGVESHRGPNGKKGSRAAGSSRLSSVVHVTSA